MEDQAEVRASVAEVLRSYGYEVMEAADPADALSTCQRKALKIDLLLIDAVMPTMSGRDLARRVAAICSRLLVLFMSGHFEDLTAHHGVLEPGLRWIQKTFGPEELAAAVRAVLSPD